MPNIKKMYDGARSFYESETPPRRFWILIGLGILITLTIVAAFTISNFPEPVKLSQDITDTPTPTLTPSETEFPMSTFELMGTIAAGSPVSGGAGLYKGGGLELTMTQDFPCYTGPGPTYDTLSTLKAGTRLLIIGYGFGGGWLVAEHPTLQGRNCWIDEDFVTVSVPVDTLRLISIPPKPAATPEPTKEQRATVCVTDQQQQLVCH